MWTVEADSRLARGCLTRLANVEATGVAKNVTKKKIMMMTKLLKDKKKT
jgi:hypothetical protein